ncbi:MAG: isocitrate/isopropylmalate dehydrogenase family protein [Thermodesulfobacteriota bacterium]
MTRSFDICVIPGDGIGIEVVTEGIKCLEAVSDLFGDLSFHWTYFDWGSEYYLKNGRMMPENGLDLLADFQAIYLGAVGDPRVPDDVSLHGLLIPIKMGFDLYVGLRPAYLFPGVRSPLADMSGGDIDIVVIRENTEGEYSPVGGIFNRKNQTLALQTGIFTEMGCERIIRHAFSYARRQGRNKVTSITKSNAQKFGMVLWDRIFKEVASEFPDIRCDSKLVDAACMEVVRNPKSYDVIVASNLFADILSDLTAGVVGGLGLAPGASFHPDKSNVPGLFDPVHGSAPDIVGKGLANPVAAILTGKMMLDFLGQEEAAEALFESVYQNLKEGLIRTPDLGGRSKTHEVGTSIASKIRGSS